MATLKELKEVYRIIKFPNTKGYLVYDNKEGSGNRCVYKYLCSLEKKGAKFKIIGTNESYSNKSDIIDAISKYVNNLEFDSEYYDPSLREGLFEELIIHDYLVERGFKSHLGWDASDTIYVLKEKNIYQGNTDAIVITLRNIGSFDKIHEKVTILFKTGDFSWIESTCLRNVNDIKKEIDSLLKPYFLTEGARNIKHSEEYTTQEFNAVIKKINPSTLDTLTNEMKSDLKTRLQELIDVL